MRASVIVLAWNGMDYLPGCLDALLSQDFEDAEFIVVDNASTDGSADFVEAHYPRVTLIRNDENLGFAAGCNVGLRATASEVLVLLNQDTMVQPGWLRMLMQAFDDPQVGIAGCKILLPDGEILEHAGGYLLMPAGEGKHYGVGERDEGQYDEIRDVEYVTGAALALSRPAFERVAGFDETFSPGYYEDVDLCVRVHQAGFKVLYWPTAVVYHYGSGSFGKGRDSKHYLSFRNRMRFLFKHFPLDMILDASIPAIMDLMARERSRDVLHGVVLGSVDVMFRVPSWVPGGSSDSTLRRVLHAFRVLHDAAVACEETLLSK